MATGLTERVAALRAARVISTKELAARTGLPYGELVRLEADPGRVPPASTLRRLAGFFFTSEEYLRTGAAPTPDAVRSGFFSYYDSLGPAEQQELKLAPIQRRLEVVVQYLACAFPTRLGQAEVAAGLGYTPQALDAVLQGEAPLQSDLLKRLAGIVGLPVDFFVRGDFFGGVAPAEAEVHPAKLARYYEVVREAIAAGISPGALQKAVRVLAVRDEEP